MDYKTSLIISCDCGSIDRLGFELDDRDIVNIDHHMSNTHYGSINVVVPSYASSSQVAFKLFSKYYTISKEVAACFYTALLSDTRYFTTSSVNEEVFSVAKELTSLGAKPEKIATYFTQRRALSSLRILEKALASLSLKLGAQVAILAVSKEDIKASGATVPDMDGIIDYAKSLATVKVAIFAIEEEEGIRISLRSKEVDISKIAVVFGGGGHKVAAGFTLKNYTLKDGIEVILDEIKNAQLLKTA